MSRWVAVLAVVVMFAAVIGCGDSGPLADTTWVLESLNGHAAVDGIHPTLRVNGKKYGGQDGCNTYSGRSWNGRPVATADGSFSAPPAEGTLRGCDSAEIAEQAEAYMDTLMEGERFQLGGDRLEIIDGTGETRLVFFRQSALPGHTAELAGTGWRLLDEQANGDRTTTLAFLNDRIVTFGTVCREYVAEYKVSGARIRFPGMSMIGATQSCPSELQEMARRHMDDLFWAGDYSVDESTGGSVLRVRTRRAKTLVYEPLPPAMDGIFDREWSLTTFVEPRKTGSYTRFAYTTDVLEGTVVTISIGENSVSGSAGCNSYSAPLSYGGSMIEVERVSTTRMSCGHRDGVMEQERHYLEVLRDVKRFNIYGDRLAMHTGDDEVLLFDAR